MDEMDFGVIRFSLYYAHEFLSMRTVCRKFEIVTIASHSRWENVGKRARFSASLSSLGKRWI